MDQYLLPRLHIMNNQDLKDFQCSICYEIEPDIVRCRGSCKKAFCLNCVTRTKINNIECPNRCSKPFQIQHIPGLKVQFKCPFKPLLCINPIEGLQKFKHHTQTCKFMPSQFSDELNKRRNYQCANNHQLIFLNEQMFVEIYESSKYDHYDTASNSICNSCGNQGNCFSICIKCSIADKKVLFCIRCRPLPCTKTHCPVGHEYFMKELEADEYSAICNFCGLAICIFGNVDYEDEACNFDICQSCHSSLPEHHPLVPLKNNQDFLKSRKKDQNGFQEIMDLILGKRPDDPFTN